MSDSTRELAEIQEAWDKTEEDRIVKILRRLLIAALIGVAVIAGTGLWLVLQLKGIVY